MPMLTHCREGHARDRAPVFNPGNGRPELAALPRRPATLHGRQQLVIGDPVAWAPGFTVTCSCSGVTPAGPPFCMPAPGLAFGRIGSPDLGILGVPGMRVSRFRLLAKASVLLP